MIKITRYIIFSTLFFLLAAESFSITYYSRTSGNWNTAATWSKISCGGTASTTVPGAADDVIICTGHTITMNGNPGSCLSLTVSGTLKWNSTLTTNVGTGGLTLSNGSSVSGTSVGTLNVAGNFTVPAGATVSIGKLTLTVTGTSNISGTLNFNSGGGTKTFSDLNINSGGSYNSAANETYTITGNLSMTGGTIAGSSTGTFNVSGNFNVGAGTSNINSGTITVIGATIINGTLIFNNTTGNKSFSDLIVNTGGTWDNSVGETITITGNLQVDGSFISGSKNYTLSGAGKTISGTLSIVKLVCGGSYTNNADLTFTGSLTGTGTLTQGPTGILNVPTNSASFSVGTFNASAAGNIVNYCSTGAQNVITPADGSYYSLTLSTGNTKTLSAATIVTGNLLISSPATLNTNNLSLTVGGNFTNNSVFSQGTGTVTFNGTTAQTIGGTTATVFNNLTVSNSTDTVGAVTNFSVSGTLTVGAGAVLMPSASVIVSGAGTLTGSGTVQVTRIAATPDFLSQYTITTKTLSGLKVDYAGAGNQDVNALNYGSLAISSNGTRTVTLPAAVVGVSNIFSPDASSTAYVITGNTIDFNGTGAQSIPAFNYNNLTSSSTGTRTLAPSGTIGIASVFTPGTNSYTITGSTIDYNGTGAQNIIAFNYNNLTSSSTGSRTLASIGTVGIAGAFVPGTNSYTITGSTVDYNGGGAQTISAFNYNNLTSSSAGTRTLASSGSIGVAAVFTPGTNTYTIAGSTIDFNGAGAQTIPAFNYNNLTSSSTGTRTLASTGTIGVAAIFTPGTNIYTITGSTINFNGTGAQTIPAFNYNNLTSSSSGARTLVSSGIIGIASVFTPGTNVYTIGGSTVDFNGTASQTIPAFNYANLTSSSTGARTLASSGTVGIFAVFTPGTNVYTIAGSTINFKGAAAQTIPAFNYNNLTSSSTGARTLAGAGIIGVAGLFTPGTNTYTITGSTIDYNGTGAQTITAFNYNNLTSSSTGARTLAPAGTIGVAAVFTPGANAYTVTGSTMSFNGAIAQVVPSFTYYNLTSAGSSAKTLGGAITVNNNLIITSNLDVTASDFTISIKKNWTNNGSFIAQNGTVTFSGATAQTINGSVTTSYNNMTVSNAGGITLGVNANIAGTLNFTSGVITTGSNKITIASTGAVTGAGTSKFINGSLEKNIAAGSNIVQTFEIGNGSTDYLPLSLNFASVGAAGNITAIVNNGDHPNVATSAIDDLKSVNRYWQLSNSGTSFTTYSAACNFIGVPADADAGSTPANYFMSVYSSGTWTLLTQGSVTATSNEGTGITTMGELEVGEKRFPVITTQPSDSTVCNAAPVSFSVAATGSGLIYQWQENSGSGFTDITNGGIYSGAATATLSISAAAYSMNTYQYRCNVGSSSWSSTTTSANAVLTVNPDLPVSVSVAASSTIICSGTNVTFTATPTNGGAAPSYQWKLNGINAGTNSATYSNAALANNDAVTCVLTSNAICPTGNPATSNSTVITVNPNLPVSVSVSASSTTVCSGTNVTFTATPTNGGTLPSYQWKVNGVNTGTDSPNYSSTTLANSNTVTCVMTSNIAPCPTGNPATSGNIVMTVNPVPTISLSSAAGTNNQTKCINTAITQITYSVGGSGTGAAASGLPSGLTTSFTAGTFKINGTPTVSGTFIYTVTTTGGLCAAATATGTITVTANATISLTSALGTNNQTMCLTNAITNITYVIGGGGTGGTVAGLPAGVSGSFSGGVFTISGTSTATGTFNYTVTTTGTCIQTTANGTITVNPYLAVSVSIASSDSSICSGTNVTFTATATNGGTSPSFQWLLNGSNVGSNSVNYSNSAFSNNDVVTCVLTSNAICATGNPATSASVTMTVNQAPGITCSDIAQFNDAGICGSFVSSSSFNAAASGSPAPAISYSQAADTFFYIGTTPVVSYATNLCGTDSCLFNIIITDSETPKLVGADSVEITTDPGVCYASQARMIRPEVSDNCDAIASFTNNAPATLAPGNNMIAWTITDINGNILNVNQFVKIIDAELPVISGLSAVTFTTTLSACSVTTSLATPVTSDNCGIASVTNDAPASFPVGTTTVTWTVTDIHGNKNYAAQTVTVIPNGGALAVPTSIAGPTKICSNAMSNVTYTTPAISGATSYAWYVTSSVATIASGQGTNTITVNYSSVLTSAHIFVAAQNACGTGQTYGILVSKVTPSITPGVISGPALICGISSATYSVALVKNATSYSWTVPSGVTITSGQGTNKITVTFAGTFKSGNVSVAGVNSCGSSSPRTLAITVLPSAPATIYGPKVTCGLTTATYSVALVTGAISYNWTLPSGITISSGQGTNVINVNIVNTFLSGNLSVSSVNACGSSVKRTVSLHAAPAVPATIFGSALVCGFVSTTYSVAAVGGATSYTWTVPSGVSITSGQGTNSINVSIAGNFTTGNIVVFASNACGNSAGKGLTIHSAPSAPGSISGATNACPYKGTLTNVKYSIASVTGATSYLWTVPSGATITSGQGTTVLYVNYSNTFTSGNITVQAVGSCGSSSARALAINTSKTAPKAISGLVNVCGISLATYSVAAVTGATSYSWSVPSGITILSGQGTNSIQANINGGFTSGTLSVAAVNNCGTSASSTLTLTGCPAKTNYSSSNNNDNEEDESSSAVVNEPGETLPFLLNMYPNPTKGQLNFELNLEMESEISIEIFDAEGKIVIKEKLTVSGGTNTIGINFEDYPAGIYLARIIDSSTQKTETKRIIKE